MKNVIITETKNFYKDNIGNTYCKDNFTKKQAYNYSKNLIYCNNCTCCCLLYDKNINEIRTVFCMCPERKFKINKITYIINTIKYYFKRIIKRLFYV